MKHTTEIISLKAIELNKNLEKAFLTGKENFLPIFGALGSSRQARLTPTMIFLCVEFNIKTCKEFYVTDGNIMYITDASRFLISCVIQHYASVVGCIMLIMTLDPGDKH